MTDIANLVLGMDTTGTDKGIESLNRLDAAGKSVGATVDNTTKKIDDLGKAVASTGEKTRMSNGQMNDTATIMRAQATSISSAEREMRKTEQAVADLARQNRLNDIEGTKFIESLNKQVAALQNNSAEMQRMKAAQLGVSSQAEGLIAQIEASGNHMEGMSFKTAGAKRELLVLGHEMASGNWSRFGGSYRCGIIIV